MKSRFATVIAGVAIFSAGAADAALLTGNENIPGTMDYTYNTSAFISVVERNSIHQVMRNLIIDPGSTALDTFAGHSWSTTLAQETQILTFLHSAAPGSSVAFNVGAALIDLSFTTDLRGMLSTGNDVGPDSEGYSQLDTGVNNIMTFIGNINYGVFNAAGVLAANSPSDRGWHDHQWGNDYGGALVGPTEIVFGASSNITAWKLADAETFLISRSVLGSITSDLATGDISFRGVAPVPVPAGVWFFSPVFGLIVPWLKRRSAG